MSIIHWVHISDLHLNKIGLQTEAMREKLPKYIERLANKMSIDYIFFTGDARHAPDVNYPNDLQTYFEQLTNAARIDNSYLHIIIGNHDIDCNNSVRLEGIDHVTKHYDGDDSVISSDVIKKLKNGRDEYNAVFMKIMATEHYKHHAAENELHYTTVTNEVNIVHVDSTLVYTKDNPKDLLIGAYALKQVLKDCDPAKPTIILSHYPFNYFAPKEQDAILYLLRHYHVQIWLTGHEHHHIVHKERDHFYVAHSGNQTFEKGTTPSFVEGMLDTDKGKGYFVVHKWNDSADWGIYPTLIPNDDLPTGSQALDDRSKYPIILDKWLHSIGKEIPEKVDVDHRLLEFIKQYRGRTFFVRDIPKGFFSTEAELMDALNVLYKQNTIKPLNYDRSQWHIVRRGE